MWHALKRLNPSASPYVRRSVTLEMSKTRVIDAAVVIVCVCVGGRGYVYLHLFVTLLDHLLAARGAGQAHV